MNTNEQKIQPALDFYKSKGYFQAARAADWSSITLANFDDDTVVNVYVSSRGELTASMQAFVKGMFLKVESYQWNHPNFDKMRQKMATASQLIKFNL